MASSEPDEKLDTLRRLSEEIIPEGEFLERARRAREEGRPLRVKYGMDPTAPDIHLGNAIALHKLGLLQEMGHLPVIIIGDYTAMVGDPSGANRTRPMLSAEEVERNAATYLAQVGRILDLSRAEIRRNGEWFARMSFGEVIRLASRTTLARLIERDDFTLRLEKEAPIGLHELLYPLMQGYDSIMVKADVELGGTDQKFNLLFAREMQRAEGQEPQVVITHPMLEGLDGRRKMSKSIGNVIGITDEPNVMFGRAMSLPDSLVEKYLRLTTDLPEERIAELCDPARTHPREAKEALARAIVTRYHSAEAAGAAAEEFRRVFSERRTPRDLPVVRVAAGELSEGGVWIVRLVGLAGFAESNSEARRLVRQGGVSLDGRKIRDEHARVELEGGEVLRVGRRRFARIEIA